MERAFSTVVSEMPMLQRCSGPAESVHNLRTYLGGLGYIQMAWCS